MELLCAFVTALCSEATGESVSAVDHVIVSFK